MAAAVVMPSLYVCHGGGPMPLLPPDAPRQGQRSSMNIDSLTADHLRAIPSHCRTKPSAILVVSAHWEVGGVGDVGDDVCVAVTASAHPPMLFDYGGFPPETYNFSYPAPGSPELASRVKTLLESPALDPQDDVDDDDDDDDDDNRKRQVVRVKLDEERGFDHGVFVPLLLAFPAADVPVVCLSLHHSLDPSLHFSIGERLAPLRREGVLILGSGVSFHNMRVLMGNWQAPPVAREQAAGYAFDEALRDAVLATNDHDDDSDNACAAPSSSSSSSSSSSVSSSSSSSSSSRVDAPRSVALDRRGSTSRSRYWKLSKWKATFPGAAAAHPREEHLIPLMVAAGAGGDDQAAVIFEDVCMGAAMTGFRFG